MSPGKELLDRIRSLSGQGNLDEENTKDKDKSKKRKQSTTTVKAGTSSISSCSNKDKVKSSDRNETEWVCTQCNVACPDVKSKMMECEKCNSHFCLSCIGMNESVYRYMKKDEVFWCCKTCVGEIREVINNNTTPEVDQSPSSPASETVSPYIMNIRKDLDECIGSMRQLVGEFYRFMGNKEDLEKDEGEKEQTKNVPEATTSQETASKNENPWKLVTKNKKSFKELLIEANQESRREAEEEHKRKFNIIIHRAPEPKANSWEERKQKDQELVNKLMDTLHIHPDIEACQRLGKKAQKEQSEGGDPETNSPRPLMVKMKKEQDVKAVMDNLKHLKDAEQEINRLRITPDRNLQEREQIRCLVTEAKNLTAKEKGEFVHLVRGKEIIRVKARKKLNSKGDSS